MKTTKQAIGLGLVAAAMFAASGCTAIQRGTAAGGVVGAVAGGVIGHNIPPGTSSGGAAIGAGSGAALGGLAGEAYAHMNEDDIKRELRNLRAQLRDKEAELANLRDALGGSPSDLELAGIRDQLRTTTDALAQANVDAERLRNQLASARGALADRDAELASLTGRERDLRNELAGLRNASDDADAAVMAAQARLDSLQGLLDQERDARQAAEARNQDLRDRVAAATGDREGLAAQLAAAERRASDLEGQLAQANASRSDLQRDLDRALADLNSTRSNLDVIQASLDAKRGEIDALSRELADMNVQLDQTSRGITLTIVDQLLFAPGKAEMSASGQKLLADVSRLIHQNFPGQELLIEGHTDNVPIRHSGWRSNWELGAHRALTVLHELVEHQGFDPSRVSAATYGEHRPAAPNATSDGRAQNRRSVIVILPPEAPISRNSLASR